MTSLSFHKHKILTPLLIEKFNLNQITKVPKLLHIQLSSTSSNQLNLFNILLSLELISLQKASIIRAKQSVASFKLKKNTALGGKITLTGLSLDNLLTNLTLINLSPSLGNSKNFTLASIKSADLGVKEIIKFSEIEIYANKLKIQYGLSITLLIKNSKSIPMTKFLLTGLQLPINN